MNGASQGGGRSLEQVRAEVVAHLRARRAQIEEAIFARIRGAGFGHVGEEDVDYAAGLRAAVAAAVELSLKALQNDEEPSREIPSAAVKQARRAARLGVSLDTVLRRYIAGQALLADFIMEEAANSAFSGDETLLHHHLRETQTALLERLTATVIEAYTDEIERTGRSPGRRRTELVLDLLAGKPGGTLDPAELEYDFDVWHVGLIAVGAKSTEFARAVAAALGCERLSVSRGERSTWLWFGRRRKFTVAEIKRLSIERPGELSLASGEPRRGIEGWRLTHQEAQAALRVAIRKPPGLTRCSEVLLEAAVLGDGPLVTALAETFLSPLDGVGYRGQSARDTLRAYFESRRNVSSTANLLGVARNTVESRLREIEERIGRPLHTCSAQLEVALRLEALSDPANTDKADPRAGSLPEVAEDTIFSDSIEQSAQSREAVLSTLASHGRTGG